MMLNIQAAVRASAVSSHCCCLPALQNGQREKSQPAAVHTHPSSIPHNAAATPQLKDELKRARTAPGAQQPRNTRHKRRRAAHVL